MFRRLQGAQALLYYSHQCLSFVVAKKKEEARNVLALKLKRQGQVALEDNFRFVVDKSDLKSASDKKFATVAFENKICEQNIT